MLWRSIYVLAAWLLCCKSFAQPPRPVWHTKLPVGPFVDTVAPYSLWKAHRGKAEDALAVLRVGERNYSTFVARCDGFFVVPEAAWNAQLAHEPISVTVTQAENESSNGPFTIHYAMRRETERADYRLLKLNDHHVRSVSLLSSDQLEKNTPLTVMWATLKPGSTAVQVLKRRATCTAVPSKRDSFQGELTYADGEAPAGLLSGALVVDEASGAAVGMITQASKPTQFSTWRYWHDMVNEVGLAPDREAAQNRAPGTGATMVKVPGGPVRLVDKHFSRFMTSFGTDIVCTADFYCDVNPVTNGEWFPWAANQKYSPALPQTMQNLNNPPYHYPNHPVAGLRVEDMERYLAAQNKRMLTEIEFLRAAYTKDMTWLRVQDEETIRTYAPLELEMTPPRHILLADRLFSDLSQRQKHLALGNEALRLPSGEQEGQPVVQEERFIPGQSHSIRLIPEDVSDFGVRHVHTNAPEVCLSWRGAIGVALKIRPAQVDPFLSGYAVAERLTTGQQGTRLVAFIAEDEHPLMKFYAWRLAVRQIPGGDTPPWTPEQALMRHQATMRDSNLMGNQKVRVGGTGSGKLIMAGAPGFRGAR